MVDTIPESLKSSLDWYTSSVALMRRVNRSLSDVTLCMPAQGKKLELELWGCGVLTYEWVRIFDRDSRLVEVVIRFELDDQIDATSLELHVQKKGDEGIRYRGAFSSSVVEVAIERFDLKQEYTVWMSMPTVR